ncbi:helix-turn-helix transcriptional regulator [Microbacterium sp. QXD-8]|uniref:Helix-turn-helix transcriptional regulator n=1 Tax=Microbacterium psychrotolerans TaxID=3068321 RepID=A0ABU0YYH5_9MICO|nr:helix-turn-helix transcriptional regulator [Microbacterium sp. QXD-8]MDQ7877390.1 helix-turn-helix transcriptional regulator [Microbacterium sp. QXD-8]
MSPGNVTRLSSVIAEALDRAFAESGMTQGDVGEASGISQSQVSKYLRGVRVPDIDVLDALCTALRLDVAVVVKDAQERRSRK